MSDNSADKRNILMLCSNTATSPATGWPIGFWWAELTHAYKVFEEAGYDVTIASPDGGDLMGDSYSDPEDPSGYSADDEISLAFKKDRVKAALLNSTPSMADLDLGSFDALFIVGGQGPMVTMIDDHRVHSAFAAQMEAGKVAAAVCHGTCILLEARGMDGELLVKDREWTGFANSEEEYSEQAAGQKIQPFWIESEARKISDTTFTVKDALTEHVIVDGNLVTGQQQVSSAAAAREVVAILSGDTPAD
ncbi:MAG: type 1 glutamine amidotransferase domain-containing protein [Pseudomonadota bacterium]